MKTTEKFAVLNSVIAATEMTEEEIATWFHSRQTSQVATTSSGGIKLIFPIAYKKGNEFEILPEFIPERKDEIWGYEIMPNIILAKKCSADGNVENTSWYNAKAFAEKCILNGKNGHLPSTEVIKQNWNVGLRNKIQKMDKFLYENGIDAETRSDKTDVYTGVIWSSEVYNNTGAYSFNLGTGASLWYYKNCFCDSDRLTISF